MGRCVACNCKLNDFEMTRKSATTGEYLDLCDSCFGEIKEEFNVLEREDLRGSTVVDLEDDVIEENE